MSIKSFNPTSPARRFRSTADFSDITKTEPERSLLISKNRINGRNSTGRITMRRRGGGHKRKYRIIDFKRNKFGVPGNVAAIEYDPNRSSRIALINYADGEKRYILCPDGLKVGTKIMSSSASCKEQAEVRVGNSLPLRDIPVGEMVHNIELRPGGGGVMARGAGVGAQFMAKDGQYGLVRLPSGEQRKVLLVCIATIGKVSNSDHFNRSLGKAGVSRWLGRRPKVRGVAMNPVDHPHGGGEGKTSGGRHPVSFSGVPTKGYKTRSNKRTDKFIVRRRK